MPLATTIKVANFTIEELYYLITEYYFSSEYLYIIIFLFLNVSLINGIYTKELIISHLKFLPIQNIKSELAKILGKYNPITP